MLKLSLHFLFPPLWGDFKLLPLTLFNPPLLQRLVVACRLNAWYLKGLGGQKEADSSPPSTMSVIVRLLRDSRYEMKMLLAVAVGDKNKHEKRFIDGSIGEDGDDNIVINTHEGDRHESINDHHSIWHSSMHIYLFLKRFVWW